MAGPRRPSGLKVMCMGSCLYVVCASMCARVCRCVCTYKCFVYKTAVVVQGRIMYEHEYMTVCARVCESRFTCVFMVLCVLPVVYARTRMCTPLLTCYVHTAFDMKTRTVLPTTTLPPVKLASTGTHTCLTALIYCPIHSSARQERSESHSWPRE